MRKIFLILTIMIIMSLSGCQTGETTGSSESTPFIGGTTGVLISFSEDAPPAEVFDGGDYPFDIDVKLKNVGEYTIPANRAGVTISGIFSADFNNVNLAHAITEELTRTTKDSEGNILEGSEYHAVFTDLNYIGQLSGATSFIVRADACYEYGTTANAKICIREDLVSSSDDDVCQVTETKEVFNSGGPVQVTQLEESAVGAGRISFSIKIANMGNGKVYKSNNFGGTDLPTTQCEDERKYEDKVFAIVDAGNTALNTALTCSGLADYTGADSNRKGFVTLYSGERTLRCNIDVASAGITGDFEKVLKVDLRYDWEEDISTTYWSNTLQQNKNEKIPSTNSCNNDFSRLQWRGIKF